MDRDLRKKPLKTEAEAGMKHPQAKEQQGMPEGARRQERLRDGLSSETLEGLVLWTPGFGTLAFRLGEHFSVFAAAPPEALSHSSPGNKQSTKAGALFETLGREGFQTTWGCVLTAAAPLAQGTRSQHRC